MDIATRDFAYLTKLYLKSSKKKNICLFLLNLIISATLEICIIFGIVPIIENLTDNDSINSPSNHFNILISNYPVVLVIFVLLATFFKLNSLWLSANLASNAGTAFGRSIISHKFISGYEQFINTDTNLFMSSITKNLDHLVVCYDAVIQTISSLIIFTAILVSLFLISPITTLVIITTLTGFYYFYYKVFKHKLTVDSKAIAHTQKNLIRLAKEIYLGFPDILSLNDTKYYIDNFSKLDGFLRYKVNQLNLIRTSPKFFIESGILLFLILMSVAKQSEYMFLNLSVTLGAVAVGIQRLLPLGQMIYLSFATIKSYSEDIKIISTSLQSPSLTKLYLSDYNSYKHSRPESLPIVESIELKNVKYAYKNINAKKFLFDFNASKGQMIGVVGPSGSGKSTLLKILLGLIEPSSGSFYINKKLHDHNFLVSNKNYASQLSYVPQKIFFPERSIFELVVGRNDVDDAEKEKLYHILRELELLDIFDFTNERNNLLVKEDAINLSGGQKQRIALARILFNIKSILILDEPTSALDAKIEIKTIELVRRYYANCIIVLCSHSRRALNYCDDFAKITNM